jgi:hypothetical protein
MKRRTRVLIIAGTALIIARNAFAGDWKLSLEPVFGSRIGTVGEYVFMQDTDGKYQKLSELDWNQLPSFYIGYSADVSWKDIHLDGAFKAFVPSECGMMSDSDWLNLEQHKDIYTKTNYSESDNYLDTRFSACAKLSYEFHADNHLSIAPEASFEYDYFSFTGKNGTAWYGKKDASTGLRNPYDSSDRTVYDFSGKTVISYKRTSCFTWIGFTLSFTPVERWKYSLSASVAPYIHTESQDHHYLTAYYFIDITSSIFSGYKAATSAAFSVNDCLSICMTVEGLFETVAEGNDYASTYENSDYALVYDSYGNQILGGAGEMYVDVSLSAVWKLF